MTVAAALLAVFVTLPPAAIETESDAARYTRLETIAAAIQAETRTPLEAAEVAATFEHESHNFSLAVHDGTRRGDHGRALCLGQLWVNPWLPAREHARTVGTDLEATRRCVRGVLAAYEHAHCPTLVGKLSVYAAGKGCGYVWPGAAARAARVNYYITIIQSDARSSRRPTRKARA